MKKKQNSIDFSFFLSVKHFFAHFLELILARKNMVFVEKTADNYFLYLANILIFKDLK